MKDNLIWIFCNIHNDGKKIDIWEIPNSEIKKVLKKKGKKSLSYDNLKELFGKFEKKYKNISDLLKNKVD